VHQEHRAAAGASGHEPAAEKIAGGIVEFDWTRWKIRGRRSDAAMLRRRPPSTEPQRYSDWQAESDDEKEDDEPTTSGASLSLKRARGGRAAMLHRARPSYPSGRAGTIFHENQTRLILSVARGIEYVPGRRWSRSPSSIATTTWSR
jgi:hypothetical protein